jgi:hypothetical protein
VFLRRLARLALALAFCAPSWALSPASLGQAQQPAADAVANLFGKLERGEAQLRYSSGQGYLPSLISALDIPVESQVLVFSKTSLQTALITPERPRAIYFNDTVSVGFIPDADLIELTAIGRDGLLRFYTLPNTEVGAPRGKLELNTCLSCHGGVVAGAGTMVVSSVTPFADGTFVSAMIDPHALLVDGRTPLEQRWGGWYVTGEHGANRHRGNVFAEKSAAPALHPTKGQNLSALPDSVEARRYLERGSDIVALMVLEHQTGFQTLAAQLNMEHATGADAETIEATIHELADYMTGANEAALAAPVKGSSRFAEVFAAKGIRGAMGHNLRELDLQTRLLRYPLSYMIETPSFDAIAPEAKAKLYRRLDDILAGRDRSAKYRRLPQAERRIAAQMLAEIRSRTPGAPA